MKFRKIKDGYLLRFENNEEIIPLLISFCLEHSVKSAYVTALGASKENVFSYFDLSAGKYIDKRVDGNCEILSLIGFITQAEGKPHAHLHISLATQDFTVVGGHLKNAVASPTCEMFVRALYSDIKRKKDAATGLLLMDL